MDFVIFNMCFYFVLFLFTGRGGGVSMLLGNVTRNPGDGPDNRPQRLKVVVTNGLKTSKVQPGNESYNKLN